MGDPHNPARRDETWDATKLEVLAAEIEALKTLGVISGGWAWHYMSPPGHVEYKHAHDHKDVDLMIPPPSMPDALLTLSRHGYVRVRTRFDDESKRFMRYEKRVIAGGRPVKVQIDLFAEDVPSIESQGVRVVAPGHLLSLYGTKHTSEGCWAVRAARKLLRDGIDPVGRRELIQRPT